MTKDVRMKDNTQIFRHRIDRRRHHLLSEINVTPMVDVMLVLLAIFMVTGQLIAFGTEVVLPDLEATPLNLGVKPIEVTLDAQENVYLGDTLLSPTEFTAAITRLAAASEAPSNQMVLVRADRSIAYGNVMELVSQIARSGFTKVAFVSVPPARPAAMTAP